MQSKQLFTFLVLEHLCIDKQSMSSLLIMTACIHHAGVNRSLDKDSRDPTSIFIPPAPSNHFPSFGLILHKMESVPFACPSALRSQSRITHIKEPFKTTKLHKRKLIFKTRNTWSYNFPPAGRKQFIQRQKMCEFQSYLLRRETSFTQNFHVKILIKPPLPAPRPPRAQLQDTWMLRTKG